MSGSDIIDLGVIRLVVLSNNLPNLKRFGMGAGEVYNAYYLLSFEHYMYTLQPKKTTPAILFTYTMPSILHVDISSFFNKVFRYVKAAIHCSSNQWSTLMERKK